MVRASASKSVYVLMDPGSNPHQVTLFIYLKLRLNKWENDLMWIWAWLYYSDQLLGACHTLIYLIMIIGPGIEKIELLGPGGGEIWTLNLPI